MSVEEVRGDHQDHCLGNHFTYLNKLMKVRRDDYERDLIREDGNLLDRINTITRQNTTLKASQSELFGQE